MNRNITCALIVCAMAGLMLTGCSGSKETVIGAQELPAATSEGFKKMYPDAKIVKVEKEVYPDGTVHYEIEYVDKNGKKDDVELDAQGKLAH